MFQHFNRMGSGGNNVIIALPKAIMTAPSNGALLTPTPTLTCAVVPGATSYDVQIASDAAFTTIVQSSTGLSTPSYTATTLTDGIYYVRFRAINGYNTGAWSSHRGFDVDGTPAATVYVATTGNDSTGNGTIGTPWKTIDKALITITDQRTTIKVSAGTYAENSSALNYLYLNRIFTNWITIEPLNVGDVVTLTDNASGSFVVRFVTGTKICFKNLVITQAGSNTQATVLLANGTVGKFVGCTINTRNWCVFTTPTAAVSVAFVNCTLLKRTGEVGNITPIYLVPGSGGSVVAHILNCAITGQGAGATPAVYMSRTAAGSGNTLAISGGTISAANYAVHCHGGDLRLTNVIVTGAGTPSVVFGTDAAATYPTSGAIIDSTVTSTTSHALLVGQQSSGVVVTGCTLNGGDFGLVMKEGSGAIVSACNITGGTDAGVYFKATVNATVRNCTINASAQRAVYLSVNPTDGAKAQNCTLTDNVIIVTGAANIFNWLGSADDLGGGICNRNIYNIHSTTGNLGTVRSTNNIANLAALQAAWSGYDVANNDINSMVIN